jgi:hypothetical protein
MGVKGGRQPHHHVLANCPENGGASMACYRNSFIFLYYSMTELYVLLCSSIVIKFESLLLLSGGTPLLACLACLALNRK